MDAILQPPPTRRLARLSRPPLIRPRSPQPDIRRARAAAAWRLVRALRARYPGRLHVVEAGEWTEGFHVLVLCDARRSAGADHPPLAMLNVGGSLHLLARVDGRPPWPPDPASTVFHVVPWTLLGGGAPTGRQEANGAGEQPQERRDLRALTVRAIAAVLGL